MSILPLRSIAVLGGGPIAASAALAFAVSLPGTRVALVTTPIHSGALADRFPLIWPSAMTLLDRLQIDEQSLVSRNVASRRLGARFEGWSRNTRPWLVAEGGPVLLEGAGRSHQRWLDGWRFGDRTPFHALFPAAVAAQIDRDDYVSGGDHSLHLDAKAFTDILIQRLRRLDGVVTAGELGSVSRDTSSSDIRCLTLADGRSIQADLFVDATGPESFISGKDDWTDWRAVLPCDRLFLERSQGTVRSMDVYEANDAGWSARLSRNEGEVLITAFGEAKAGAATIDGEGGSEPVRIRPGRRTRFWVGNLLTIGEAAVDAGPLELPGATLAFAQIELALDLLPGRDLHPLLLDEYNRRTRLRADSVRDYLGTFYHGGGRRTGEFWQGLDASRLPGSLRRTLSQFERRGELPQREEALVEADNWHMALLGQGVRPELRDPIRDARTPEERVATIRRAAENLRLITERLAERSRPSSSAGK
jgi:tryptophan halogenase